MKNPDQYILGCQPVPDWCKDKLMPYQKLDGSVGFLFYGSRKDFEMNVGDRLIKQGERIKVRRKGIEQWTRKNS